MGSLDGGGYVHLPPPPTPSLIWQGKMEVLSTVHLGCGRNQQIEAHSEGGVGAWVVEDRGHTAGQRRKLDQAVCRLWFSLHEV